MQLKALTLNGFKSFADKTTIEFDHGLTGIVGPNGSGKSNITEAIRWALGEQSAKSLRGERMGDVIFAGTAQRPPLNRAEVTLTFNNADGYLKDQPEEVSVTRRLFRSGESDFLINKRSVRLRDVVEMFMDSGLGRESFAFISQGRVEAIFNSKPEDRRGIFEEAAGVLKYKTQKTKAQAQLQETSDNLARVFDIVHELSGRMDPLAEQASIAQDYEQQTKEYRTLHQQLLALEVRDMGQQQEQTQNQAAATKQKITELNDLIAKLEAESDELTAEEVATEDKLNHANDDLLAKSTQLESLTGAENVSTTKTQNANTTLADLNEQVERAQAEVSEAKAQLVTLTGKRKGLDGRIKELQAKLRALGDAAETPETINAQLDQLQGQYINTLQAQADNRNELAGLEKEQQLSSSQLQATQDRLAELDAQKTDLTGRQNALNGQLTAAQEQYDALQEQYSQQNGQVAAASKELQQATATYNDHHSQYVRAEERHKTLAEMATDYAGFYGGVRTVLKAKAQLHGVIGAVAELMTVPGQYQEALDQALGGSLQSIVTTDENAAKAAIAYLKQRRAGRANFLPQSVIRPRNLPSSIVQTLNGERGFIGIAVDLVSFKPELQNIMSNLLGSLIVVDNLDNAVGVARVTGHRYRIVTLDGDIMNAGGSMSGGSRQQSKASPLARAQEVQRLAAQVTKMREQLALEEQNLDELNVVLSTAQSKLSELVQKRDQAHTALQNVQGDARLLTDQLQQLARQRANLELSMPAGTVDLADKQASLQTKAEELATKLANLQSQTDNLKAQLADVKSATDSRQQQRAQVQADLAVAKNDQQTAISQQQQWQATETRAAAEITKLTDRIAAIHKAAELTASDRAGRKELIVQLRREIKDLKQAQTTLTEAKAGMRTRLSRISAQTSTAYSERQTAMSESETQAVTLSRLKQNLGNRLDTLRDDYETTYEAALTQVPKPEPDQPQLRSRLKLLKRGIDELGPVNPHAVAEYQEVKERYDFLTKQQDDLNSAKDQLLGTMAELDDEVRTRFKEVFDATSKAFTEIFPQMFGGGHAELRLTNPDDLLTTGIEIIASPPGKKLVRLSLLSGGERALTAITLLFAILRVRPVPFSILDEVEASLDEANVDRFGAFLQHYSSSTQFIVITHRRGTMVAADVLYGVTMQESGVSRMVAVSLDEAVTEKAASTPK
ncbi:chromosome segregation protein SMC [Lacticaseibacillus sharpeae]|uniref:Chromosome partition protein Smc n=1 Tax=Lacticaseibacillus sharpeae JCM 1186 = DSM 20505 TaxID=1291052 RepID=A0A0R1ZMX3_9LACO|nr:chromosome segregation protein SMC [Lacticaseibacillus sharpeae]KRM56333.1 chromosome segregation protein SMC [Lacticaseibacillus sharpeae JCM 1186 = DSM 20505]